FVPDTPLTVSYTLSLHDALPISGEILLEDFLKPLGLSQYRLAQGLSVPPRRINEIVLGKRAISADTALRLARFFGTSERFWLNLDRKSTRLNSSHLGISYAVFCL